MFSVLFVIATFVVSAGAFSNGPGGTCSAGGTAFDNAAGHGGMGAKGGVADTFTLTAGGATEYTPETTVDIKIEGGNYQGFLIKADGGSFAAQSRACDGETTAATHADKTVIKTAATVHTWTAPATGGGPIKIQALVVSSGAKAIYQTAEITLTEAVAAGLPKCGAAPDGKELKETVTAETECAADPCADGECFENAAVDTTSGESGTQTNSTGCTPSGDCEQYYYSDEGVCAAEASLDDKTGTNCRVLSPTDATTGSEGSASNLLIPNIMAIISVIFCAKAAY